MPTHHRPRLTLGAPVFNGENYLAEALDSALAQTFDDFELILCDNGSTDRTPEICQDYVERDPRVDYVRSERNLGAAFNFNRAVALAQGEYFKWVCHDDVMEPTYLARCIERLDAVPDAALCHSLVRLIGPRRESLDVHDSDLVGADDPSAATRFAALVLRPHQCTDLDGVMRTAILRRTARIGAFHGSDRALLAELALCGRILQVPAPLFMTREHPARYRRAAVSPELRLAFHDTTRQPHILVPTWTLYADYIRMVVTHTPPGVERLRCYETLLLWWPTNWNWARLLVDLVAVVAPGALVRAEQLKQRIFSPEPGPRIPAALRNG